MRLSHSRIVIVALLPLFAAVATTARQAPPARAGQPFTVVAADGRRPLPATQAGDQVMVALDDLAALFQLAARTDSLGGAISVTYKGRSVLLTPGQNVVSSAGRLVSLPAPVREDEASRGHAKRWLVPIEFLGRALAPIYDARLEVRKSSHLVLVGDVRVPRLAVSAEPQGAQTRVTIDISPRTPHVVTQEGTRLLVRFDADLIDASIPAIQGPGPLQGIRVEGGTTVVLELGPRFGSFRASLSPGEGNASQLVVDLASTPTEPFPVPPPPKPSTPPAPADAAMGAPGVSDGLHTIVIDPGHGGDEIGAKGASGTVEKDLTLSLARRLRSALESRLGLRVLLTRDGDQAVALDDRAALANNNKADLFLSLHANASLRADVSGAQIFFLSANQECTEAGHTATARQSLPTLGGGSRDIELILWEMAQTRHLTESAALSAAIEGQFRGRVRLNVRPVRQAPFRVLAGANMPAALVEVGFLTNPDEEQQLQSDAYQGAIVQALLDGLLQFRDAEARGLLPATAPAAAPPQPGTPVRNPGGASR